LFDVFRVHCGFGLCGLAKCWNKEEYYPENCYGGLVEVL
jgi:hypothetical protein